MKFVTIPEDVVLGVTSDGKEIKESFVSWLRAQQGPLNSAQFGKDGSTIRMSISLENRFAEKGPGDVVPLEKAEWEILHESAERPPGVDAVFNTPLVKLFVSFMDAIKYAKDE